MPKPVLGIHSPYEWAETALMATQLADYAARAECSVVWFPTTFGLTDAPDDPGLHHAWDGRARDAWEMLRKYGTYQTPEHPPTDVVYFVHDPSCTLPVAEDAQRIAVLSSDFLRSAEGDPRWIWRYDTVICPSEEVYHWARGYAARREVLCLPWDTGYGYVDECPPRNWDGIRLFVLVDGLTASRAGQAVLWTLRRLLYRLPQLRVTLTSTWDWPSALRSVLHEMRERYADRLILTPCMSLFERRRAYRTHDWAWMPTYSATSGAFLLEGIAYGLPVVGFDVPPASEFLIDGCHGGTMPCGGRTLEFCATSAASYLMDRLPVRLCRDCLAPLELRLSRWQQTWDDLLRNHTAHEIVESIW